MAASRAVPKSLVRCFFLGDTPWYLSVLLALLAAHASVAVDASQRQPLAAGLLVLLLLLPDEEKRRGHPGRSLKHPGGLLLLLRLVICVLRLTAAIEQQNRRAPALTMLLAAYTPLARALAAG